MKRLTFRKWKRKLTPSGMSDNGIWRLSSDTVMFPTSLFDDSATVVETVSLFTTGPGFNGSDRGRDENYTMAWKVTNGKRSWYIDSNPLNKL